MKLDEMRRRVVSAALQSLLRTTETRLRCPDELSKKEVRRILICRPNHRLGNLLMLTPLIVELKRTFPAAEVDIVLAGEHGPELFCAFGNVKHIYCLPRKMVRHLLTMARTLIRVRRVHYDLAVDPCEASQSSRIILAWMKAKYVIGIPRGESMHDSRETIEMRWPPHMAKWPIFLLRRALKQDSSEISRSFPTLTIKLTSDERRWGRQVLHTLTCAEGQPSSRPILGLFADATGQKRFAEEWWLRFVEELQVRHPDIAVVEIAPPDGHSRLSSTYPSFSSPNVREVAAVISNMTWFVSADCGLMHLACASETPTFGLFSVTDISKYEPYGPNSSAIATKAKSPAEVAQLASAAMKATQTDAYAAPVPSTAANETKPARCSVAAS